MSMKNLLSRAEVPEDKKWDLSLMYGSLEEWEKGFRKLDSILAEFNSYKGRLGYSPETLAKAIESSDLLERHVEKLHVFAHLRSDEDTADSENITRLERISSKSAEVEGETAWFIPEILSLDDDRMKHYLESIELEFYRYSLKEIFRDKPYVLSAPEERILGLASDIFSTPHGVFSVLNDADIKFPAIRDWNGDEIELTHGNYSKFLESENREIRKSAFCAVHDTYSRFRNTFAAVLDGTVKTNVFDSEVRNFPSSLSSALHDEDIPLAVYDNVTSAVKAEKQLLHRYFDIRRKVMKLDRLEAYDLRNPLVHNPKMDFSWENACADVLKALSPMGKEYCGVVKDAYSKRWIDVLENRGKHSGAYSGGCYDSPPYILMNFNGTLNEVFTLAHELGHSLNSWYSDRTQKYHYCDISIFLSEIASNVNELLLYEHYMSECEDDKTRLYLLNHFADEFRSVVFRQAMFSEYEEIIYEKREEGIPLSADLLCELYYGLNREYHGEAVSDDRRIEIEWARIPHFHYNFYVFKYVTGFAAAIKIVQNIRKDPDYVGRYIKFLSAGSSSDVMEILDDIDIHPEDPGIFTDSFKKFNEVLIDIEKIFKIC